MYSGTGKGSRPEGGKPRTRSAAWRISLWGTLAFACGTMVAFAFLHKELTDSLPRKFKIAFAGCPEDCIATAINDVMASQRLPAGRRVFIGIDDSFLIVKIRLTDVPSSYVPRITR